MRRNRCVPDFQVDRAGCAGGRDRDADGAQHRQHGAHRRLHHPPALHRHLRGPATLLWGHAPNTLADSLIAQAFDDLLLLKRGGRVIYMGTARQPLAPSGRLL